MKIKIAALFLCFAFAFAVNDYVQVTIIPLQLLEVDVWRDVFYYLPWIAGIVSYFILTIRLKDKIIEPTLNFIRRNRLIERLILVIIVMYMAQTVPENYCEKRLVRIPVPKGTYEKIDWLQFRASLDFKVTWGSLSSKGEGIYFERVPGRIEKVEALLKANGVTH